MRTALYLPAVSSLRFIPQQAVFYTRPPSGKLGVIAVMLKLLSLCYSLWKNLPMGLLHTTAADLPHVVQTHAKVIAMVARAESAAGARLRPVFEQFATNYA